MSDTKPKNHKLTEVFATAICGNDILSSALYVSGIAALFAGIYAPIVLLAIGAVLFLYKAVYREVVEALPVNGGVYNALLNGTSKTVAAVAGVMTILSYVATAVISAKTGVEYLVKFVERFGMAIGNEALVHAAEVLVFPGIIIVLGTFALLVISGVKDSAKVATGIFIFHIISLTALILFGLTRIFSGETVWAVNALATQDIIAKNGGLLKTLFLAFSVLLLGVSGFESSANFVEEQEKGVFKKTLRNMLLGVVIFNPLIAYVTLNFLPLPAIGAAKDFLLADVAFDLGGLIFTGWIALNAFLVLCGAVLTSFIGVSGLVNRMSLDACLPAFLIKENKNKSHPRIVVAFFLLCTSILLITQGDLLSLAGVYTISFLGVMSLFALGNLILRQTRTELKRPYTAPILFVIFAFLATVAGLIGNILIDPRNGVFFLLYFVPAFILVFVTIYQKDMLATFMLLGKYIPPVRKQLMRKYSRIIDDRFYVFLHHTNRLYNALDYINRNENGWNITFIHCDKGDTGERKELQNLIPNLQKAGVFPHLNLEFEYLKDAFSPETVKAYVQKHKISANKIFIGSIHHSHDFDYEDFGGVRIIS